MDEIVLVLGGGGARGLAHVGVIRALEEGGVRVHAIAACSMGGIVGAFLASGADADRMEAVAREIRYADLLAFGEVGGVVGGDGIATVLRRYLPERFEDLNVPLSLTAVDVQRGELVILRDGPLVPALRATSALPGLIAPVEHEDRLLVDGGLLNNLPVDVGRTLARRPVVAVDVAVPPDRSLALDGDKSAWSRLREWVQPQRAALTGLFMKSFDIPQALVTRMRLTMTPPDVLIRPALDTEFGVEQFGRIDEALAAGYDAGRGALAALRDGASPPAPEE